MNKLSPTTVAILEKLLGKLVERSSVAAYLVTGLAVFGIKDHQIAAQLAGWIGTAAGALLFMLNDATFGSLLKAKPTAPAEVIEPKPVTMPEPLSPPDLTSIEVTTTEEIPMSKLSAYFAVIKQAGDAVLTAELTAPAGATGADKLDIAKSALETAYPELGIADVAFETIWPMVKPFIDTLVAKFKAVPKPVVA